MYYYNSAARNGLQIGQKLWIPTENKETEINREVKQKNFDFFYHVASSGETIDHVASIYLVPKRYIFLANPGLQGPLKEGEYIKIPVEEAYKILDAQAAGTNTTQHVQSTQTPTIKHIKVPAPPRKKEKKTTFNLPVNSNSAYHQTTSGSKVSPYHHTALISYSR